MESIRQWGAWLLGICLILGFVSIVGAMLFVGYVAIMLVSSI